MKKTLLAGAALLAITGAASAADLTPTYAPGPVPVPGTFVPASAFSWSGFYAGVNAGYAFNDSKRHLDQAFAVAPPASLANATVLDYQTGRSRDGFAGGGQFGYNIQFGQGAGLVVGVETDIQYADLNGGRRDNAFAAYGPGFVDLTGNRGVDYFGTVRARLGYGFGPTLVYATGGFAYGGNGGSAHIDGYKDDDTKVGYAVGAGVEFALSSMPFLSSFGNGVTFRVEGMYVDLQSDGRRNDGTVVGYYAPTATPYLSYGPHRTTDSKFAVVRAGLNYKFGTY